MKIPIVVLATAFVLPAVALGQQAPIGSRAWEQVEYLAAGTRVRVTLLDGSQVEGQLVDVLTYGLVLERSVLTKGRIKTSGGSLDDAQTFFKSNIASVQVPGPRRGTPLYGWIIIGAAVFYGYMFFVLSGLS